MSGGYQKKWVPKGENQKEDGTDAGPTGPCYARPTLLRFFELLHSAGIPDDFKLGYKTDVREGDAGAGDESPVAKREALRELLKTQKQAKAKAKENDKAPVAKAKAKAQQIAASMPRMPPQMPPHMAAQAAQMWMPHMPPMLPTQQMWVPPMPYLCPMWGTKCTVKLSNVPPAYKQETLAGLIVHRFRGVLDFLFLPEAPEGSPDGVNNCGHAFLNFRVEQSARAFTTMCNNVAVSAVFPGADVSAEPANVCKVQKMKVQTLDKLLEEARQQASSGKQVRLPILLDMYGNSRPIPTGDVTSAASAAAAAAAAAAMSAAAMSANSPSAQLRTQIEYYFSFENMCRDVFLRTQMDEEGWVPMSLIAGFNKVKQFGVGADSIGKYLLGSEVVEVDNEKQRLRQKDAEQRVVWELRQAVDGKDEAKEASTAKAVLNVYETQH